VFPLIPLPASSFKETQLFLVEIQTLLSNSNKSKSEQRGGKISVSVARNSSLSSPVTSQSQSHHVRLRTQELNQSPPPSLKLKLTRSLLHYFSQVGPSGVNVGESTRHGRLLTAPTAPGSSRSQIKGKSEKQSYRRLAF
jgi:hypothetical protein